MLGNQVDCPFCNLKIKSVVNFKSHLRRKHQEDLNLIETMDTSETHEISNSASDNEENIFDDIIGKNNSPENSKYEDQKAQSDEYKTSVDLKKIISDLFLNLKSKSVSNELLNLIASSIFFYRNLLFLLAPRVNFTLIILGLQRFQALEFVVFLGSSDNNVFYLLKLAK
jgi:zona occludens toxin (predicted ATPase)